MNNPPIITKGGLFIFCLLGSSGSRGVTKLGIQKYGFCKTGVTPQLKKYP